MIFLINFNQTRPHYKKYVVFTWYEHAKNSSRDIKQKESLQIPFVMKTNYEQWCKFIEIWLSQYIHIIFIKYTDIKFSYQVEDYITCKTN